MLAYLPLLIFTTIALGGTVRGADASTLLVYQLIPGNALGLTFRGQLSVRNSMVNLYRAAWKRSLGNPEASNSCLQKR